MSKQNKVVMAIALILVMILAGGQALALTGDTTAAPTAEATVEPTETPTPTPTQEPTPTPEPTIDPAMIPAMRAIGEYEVYHTSDGKYYHKTAVCGSMKNAKVHTLESAVAAGKKTCPYCNPISSDALKITDPVYVDADGTFHIDYGCESVSGEFTVAALEDVIADAAVKPCEDCGAIYYTEGKPILTAADVGLTTEELEVVMTKNGNLIVYCGNNSTAYHTAKTCAAMPGKTLLPLRLDDALIKGLTPCEVCNAPAAEPID